MLLQYRFKIQSASLLDKEKPPEFYQAQRQHTEAASYLQTLYKENTEDPQEVAHIAYAYMMSGNLPATEKY